jgi:hypothetical protein
VGRSRNQHCQRRRAPDSAKSASERTWFRHYQRIRRVIETTKDLWIRKQARNAKKAREVEQHFLDKGCEDGPGGGDDGADHVYAYKMSTSTDP